MGAAQLVARVPVASRADLQGLLEAHTAACMRDLRDRPGPRLYAAGVRYRQEARGVERWQLPSETRARRWGDCEDLGTYRAAELRLSGEDPAATATFKRTGPTTLHCIVRRGDGRIEDPSRRLGMGRRSSIGAEMATTSSVRWNVRRTPDGWMGEVVLPFDPSKCGGMAAGTTVRAVGKTKGDAAGRTLKAVDSVLSSPLVQAMLPPGAGLALQAAKNVAKLFSGLFKKKKRAAKLSGYGVTPQTLRAELRRRGVSPGIVMLGALAAEQDTTWSHRG